jgi:hypothetical protein
MTSPPSCHASTSRNSVTRKRLSVVADPIWASVLGHDNSPVDLVDRHGRGPTLGLQPMEAARPQRNRIHVDISVPHDEAGR